MKESRKLFLCGIIAAIVTELLANGEHPQGSIDLDNSNFQTMTESKNFVINFYDSRWDSSQNFYYHALNNFPKISVKVRAKNSILHGSN